MSGKRKHSGKATAGKGRAPSRSSKKTDGAPSAKASRTKGGSPLSIRSQHIDFLTYKSSQLRKFYAEVLELPAEMQDVDGLDYLLVKTSPTSSIGFMPPHPEMRSEQAAPREPSLYFLVGDIDRAYRYLTAKGVSFSGPPETMPWGHRVVATTDPEGRTVMIAAKAEPED
jgi:predicted enzyme related to lactoylglutathione lyase